MTAKPNRPRQFREEDLDFLKEGGELAHGLPQKTFARLLPSPRFAPWTKPEPALPIDDAVAGLLARTRAPRIAGKEKEGDPCPYWKARNGVARAAILAYLAYGYPGMAQDVGKAANEVGGDITTALGALERLVAHFERRTEPGRKMDMRGGVQPRAERADRSVGESRSSSLAAALPELERAIVALTAVQSHLIDRTGELDLKTPAHLQWRAAFLEDLGATWFELTGENPTTGATSPFHGFVLAAFATIGGENGVPWEHGLREVITRVEKRPHWDRFDRYAAGHLPPGVERDTPEDRRARATRMAESALKMLADLVARAVAGDRDATADLEQTIANRPEAETAVLIPLVDQMKRGDWQISADQVRDLVAARAEDEKNSAPS